MRAAHMSFTMVRMDNLQDGMRAWLRGVLQERELTPNALAQRIGKSPTTLTRFLNDTRAKHTLSLPTVQAIVRATGANPPDFTEGKQGGPQPPAEGAELDGLELPVATGDSRVDEAVRYLCQADDMLTPWRLNTRAIEGLGYLPGDVVIVDLSARAEPGDIVVAQVYRARGADTVFRIYNKPFLTAAANDRVLRPPLLVDDDRVAIRGAVVAMFRPRRGHLQAA